MMAREASAGAFARLGRAVVHWLAGWWRIVHFGALIGVLALSPSSYTRENRAAIARDMVFDTAPVLVWFTLLSSLISLVLIRIVVVTAQSYGLSQYALQMVVRVMVLELIPLTAALFVAVRCTIPNGAEIAALRRRGDLDAQRAQGVDPMSREVLPRVLSGLFSVAILAALSGVVSLVLAYLAVYGFTPWGLGNYTRTVGQVFSPAVTMIFVFKTLMFGLAVSLIPMGSALYDAPESRSRTSAELRGLVRMFALLLLIEAASLVGNYY
jgi:phospholipid/cholesterol/gamma-HCH transport system permease protein